MTNNTFNNKYSGFFLIELVISLAIFTVFTLLISQVYLTLISQEYDLKQNIKALNLANIIIEEIAISNIYNQKFKYDNFDITIEISNKGNPTKGKTGPLSSSKNPTKSNIKIFQQAKIIISWQNFFKNMQKMSLNFGWIA